MYKIKYVKKGHTFTLPKIVAEDLKEKSPNDYLILEKDGVKFKDKINTDSKSENDKSILSKVLDKPSKRGRKKS